MNESSENLHYQSGHHVAQKMSSSIFLLEIAMAYELLLSLVLSKTNVTKLQKV